ncbi:MAG: hypothetical protein MdMp014T_0645 [Treponematales bacterium]
MKKKAKNFLGLVFAVIGAVLVIGGCDNGVQEIEGTVSGPAIAAPAVTASATSVGVLLEWDPIIEAASYAVYRKTGDKKDIGLSSSYLGQNPETGKVYYRDIVSDSNKLASGTAYTYTVVANPRSSTNSASQTSVEAATGTLPAKGDKLAAPSVAFELDEANSLIKVTVTPAASGVVLGNYYVTAYVGTSSVASASITYPSTEGTITWSSHADGKYTARAYATGNGYFTQSDTAVSAATAFESLFATSWGGPNSATPIIDATNTLTGYYTTFTLSGVGKNGAAYSVERAPVDEAGNAGTYAAVTLSKSSNTASAPTAAELTADFLGNLPISTVYDRGVPKTPGAYKYRLAATKSGKTQYLPQSGTVPVNPRSLVINSLPLSVGAQNNATAGHTKYAVTPGITFKDALQTGDEVVVYWIKGGSSAGTTGPWLEANKVTFTKANIEAGTVQTIDITDATYPGDYIFVRAYLVVDGERSTNLSGNFTGSGYSAGYGDYILLNFFKPSNAQALTAGTPASGNIATSGGTQWFSFTATAATQYIHVNFGTLTDLYVQVYDSSGSPVSGSVNLWSSTKYTTAALSAGQVYYVRVWPYSGSGTYQIAFSASSATPTW